MSTVPFFIANIGQGLLKGYGLVSLHGNNLRLEIDVVDGLTGFLKINHLIYNVAISELASASMKSYAYGAYTMLSLQATRMDVFAGFPKARSGRCRLRIARRDREMCARFIEHFDTVISGGVYAQTG